MNSMVWVQIFLDFLIKEMNLYLLFRYLFKFIKFGYTN